ncbi:putative transcription factor C3H family [Helianthus annuus]|uniref:Putative U2 auxiliary factor small subunit n=1 Tax=Helianthus annuus TaxID=4232 RepID=A0A251UL47_HELAN|nr:putative transcription factor C3H family [Helianthus annuus]KAJ0501738.1 putative transcription factor C3H family [Helianthus annuus]KAJ0509633.1 putative transcription factor C3H family [Helianthus annuus]KAJ0517660.1 putative transcription factor C3H family [Helianthus annuus]KAJ0685677.1 putative transcription factor C3H family [Helianthus annuus]
MPPWRSMLKVPNQTTAPNDDAVKVGTFFLPEPLSSCTNQLTTMAEHLASIFGTEKDRVNCLFYFKIGACRHGDRCSRLHTKPPHQTMTP